MKKSAGIAARYAAFILTISLPTALVLYYFVHSRYVANDSFALLRLAALIAFIPILAKYAVHIVVAPLYSFVELYRTNGRAENFCPTVSVLIPAWNEEVGVLSTVRSVLATNYPHLEIIVINDGSTDRTHEIVNEFIAEYSNQQKSAKLSYLLVENGGKARALNAGLAIAHGEIVVTIDSDSIMDLAAISNMVVHFSDPRVASVAGNVLIGNRKAPLGMLQQLEYLYGFFFKRADSVLNSVYIVGGAAAAYRKETIVAIGGFDEHTLTEDIEMSTRLQYHGHLIRYAANAIVYTEGPSDFKGLCRQRFRWKYGRLVTFYKYRDMFFSLDTNHNRYLSFVVLPIALFAECLLFFEVVLVGLFLTYTIRTHDYLPLLIVIAFLTSVIWYQILTDKNIRFHKNLLLVAPSAWALFYVMDVVEYQALLRSLWALVTRRDPEWQRWTRVGVFSDVKSQ